MITFAVDDVEPARDRLATRPIASLQESALAHGGDPDLAVIDHGDVHPLLAAVGRAFAEHRPLVLSPDAVWLTIAQGVGQHVRLHAKELRGRLVRHDGKQPLVLQRDGVPRDAAEWASAITGLRELLAEQIGDGRARVLECDFSTTTDVDRIASQIVLLDAYSPFFSYWMSCICGIPEVTLLGTADDWRRIRERVDVIAELELEWWCKSLRPIADHFVRAAGGNVDRAFWQRIYNPADAYGGASITGWITRLWPYLQISGTVDRRNHMLELPIDEPKQKTVGVFKKRIVYDGPGVSSDTVPATLSRARLRIVNHATQALGAVELVAGVTAVVQDANGALMPISGWHVEPATQRMADVIERIFAEDHAVRGAHDGVSGDAEVVELFSSIREATLCSGKWQLAQPVNVELEGHYDVWRIAKLPGDFALCSAHRFNATRWIVCRVKDVHIDGALPHCRAIDPPDQVHVLAGTLAEILDAALDTDGDLAPMIVGTLAQ
ncbi:MAG TPA: DUF4419 domain-containing protein [Kofleriaceae bacterium]|nr:DUF4419 domain-containing protein [Kofleriaceae bacterium]